jgi:hypothetical protein
MVVTTLEVAVRETEELSVYVAEAWLPMEVPAAVWAVAPVGASIATATIASRRKDQPVKTDDSLPVFVVLLIAFSL